MELLVTIAYLFAIRLVFFDFKWLRFNLVWGLVLCGIYIAAVLTEVILLGQFTPYSKSAFVQNYVIPMGPNWGGEVRKVHAKRGVPIKKGDPLFTMEQDTYKNKVDEFEAKLVLAKQNILEMKAELAAATDHVDHEKAKLKEAQATLKSAEASAEAARALAKLNKDVASALTKSARRGATAQLRADRARQDYLAAAGELAKAEDDLDRAKVVANDRSKLLEAEAQQKKVELSLSALIDGEHASVREIEAKLNTHKIRLKERTVVAPSDGYVVNLQLRPGTIVRLKIPLLTFVGSTESWIVVKIRQKGAQHVKDGDIGEVAFDMYPGKVFPAVVERIVWASGNAQFLPTGVLPKETQVKPGEHFFVVMKRTGDFPDYPLRFGAKGIAAIYASNAPDALRVLRKIEIRSESYLNYFYNPF